MHMEKVPRTVQLTECSQTEHSPTPTSIKRILLAPKGPLMLLLVIFLSRWRLS